MTSGSEQRIRGCGTGTETGTEAETGEEIGAEEREEPAAAVVAESPLLSLYRCSAVMTLYSLSTAWAPGRWSTCRCKYGLVSV